MRPYITFVAAARNDNYEGDFLYRMQLFVSTLAALVSRHRLRADLLLVEWNPPPDRPCLRDAIHWPRDSGLGVRIVTVPENVHRALPNSEKMPMFEMIAKNCGIRRASGDFVLVTNPDIIFSDEAIAYFAQGSLPEGCFVRANRHDVGKRVPMDVPVDQMLRFCSRNVIRVWRGQWGVDERLSAKVRSFVSRPNPARLVQWVWRSAKERNMVHYDVAGAQLPMLHIGAAGDFMLMSRDRWHSLRGFPGLPTHSWIDVYMVYLASAAGLKQLVMPHRIYHQEHEHAEHASRPLTMLERIPAFQEMLQTHKPVSPNDDDWGLRDLALPECHVSCSPGD
ncbi:MAG: hypothetical protein ABSF45_03400 [Terriglobia bacterium]